jgi:hypothetical protein
VESAQDPYGWKNMDDPKIAFDANGKAHIVYLYSDANDPRKYEVHYATNQSGSWVIKTLVTGTSGIDEVHEPQIQVDQANTIHITYVKEDNQNSYYGNVYYTHKNVSDPNFPAVHEKIIDSITDQKYPTPFVVDSSGKIYLSYSDEAYTSYLLTNKSGTWIKEVIANDGISYPIKASVIDNKPYVIMYKDTGGPSTFFAMVKDAGTWKKGTKEVTSQSMSGYPMELISEMDPSGNIMLVMEETGLRNVKYLYGTSDDFGLNFAPPLSSNADITNLTVSPGTLVPGFSSGTTNYSVSVGYNVPSIIVTPTAADPTATIMVDNQSVPSGEGRVVTLQTGANLIPVKVTAQDGTVKTYTITVQKAAPSNNALLANLTVSTGTLNPIFAASVKDYSISVPNSTSQMKFTPTTADATATVTVGRNPVKSGQESPLINLAPGENTIPIIVTAQNGSTVTYTVKVNRNRPPAAAGRLFSVNENATNGTVVGNMGASDPDGQALSYRILSGNEKNIFNINDATGEITVANGSLLDFETTQYYSLHVEVSDGLDKTAAAVTIVINDLNDNVPVAKGFTKNIDENLANGTVVGQVTATDVDANSSFSYKITAGNGDGAFAIDQSSGEVIVANSLKLDYEMIKSFVLTIQVSDGVHTVETTATIHLNNLNDNKPIAEDAVFNVDENSPNWTVVGKVNATDADGDVLRYQILSGNEDGAFRINAATGEITVADSLQLDYEKKTIYQLKVQALDTEGTQAYDLLKALFNSMESDIATITINVNNVNDHQPIPQGFTRIIGENTAAGTSVGFVTATDEDEGSVFSYRLTAGNEAGAFAIDENTGEVTVADSSKLDYEKVTGFTLTVEVSDGDHTAATTVTIGINNLNDNQPMVDDAVFAIDENAAAGTAVGTVTGSDADKDVLHYAITAGNESGAFNVNSETGTISVANAGKLDFEKVQSFTLTVQVSDGLHTAEAAVKVNLNNVNDNTPVSEDVTFTIDENSVNGTVVGTVTGSDADGDSLHYKIAAGNEAGAFAIDETTGEVKVADSAKLDYEMVKAFALTVEVNDGLHTAEAAVAINLKNVNDNAPVGKDATFTIEETANTGTKVGMVEASDADGDGLTFTIQSGNDEDIFTVNETTGDLSVADSSRLSAKEKAIHVLSIGVSDGKHTSVMTATVHILSSDATLSGLTSSAGNLTPAFTPGVIEYTVYVANTVEKVTFTPTAAHSKATLKMNGKSITSGDESEGVLLKEGRNVQTIEVTSENGLTTTYTITVIRLKPVSKVTPKASDKIVTVPDEEVDLLDEKGTLIFDLKGTLAQDKVVKLTAVQLATLIKRHASIQIIGKDVQMLIPAVNFAKGEDVTISVEKLDKNTVNIPFSKLAVGDIYELTIKQGDRIIHQFDHEIDLSFSVNGHAQPEQLKVHYFNEEKKAWELVGGTLEGDQVRAETNHFSTFALFQPNDLVKKPDLKPTTEGNLPDTSTNMYNWLLAGLFILILGGAMLRVQRVGRK